MEILATSHVHSQWSYDGSWTLESLAASFSRRGSRVLLMTEHDRGFSTRRLEEFRAACAAASSQKILIVPGIEYSDAANRVHVLVWGPVPFLGEGLSTSEMLDAVHDAGGLAVLAHPTRREAWKSFEPRWASRLLGIEAWNRKYDGWAPSRTAPGLLNDAGAVPFVGLDFHTRRQSFPLAMALELEGPVNEANVLDCLRARRCEARAFGLPLAQNLVRRALPVLGFAERSRKAAASLVRYSRRLHGSARPARP
jgi:hypothetical protein